MLRRSERPTTTMGSAGFLWIQPQNPTPQQRNQTVIGIVNAVFANPKCAQFLKTILNKASTEENPVLHGGDIAKIFSDFLAQKEGGIMRGSLPGARYGSVSG